MFHICLDVILNQRYRRLIEILLLYTVTRATEKLLFGKGTKYTNYNEYINSGVILDYQDGDYKCKVYPMFHPGFYGEKNRVGGFDRHIEDWKRIMA